MDVVIDELSRELRPPLTADAAIVEADRCLECGGPHAPAPCVVGCPANVDVPGFVAAIAAGDPARLRARSSPRTSSAARVRASVRSRCSASATASSSTRVGAPIEIGALQRYATDWAYRNGVPLRAAARSNGKSVAVVGAGPAGLAAAGELAARGYAVTVYDEREEVGGLVRYAIAPYRQTNEPLPDEARLLADLGVEFRLGTRVDAARLEELSHDVDAVVLAVGMGADVDVSYDDDDLEGVWESLPFIERLKSGEPPAVGGRVAVVGGGNTAVDVAIEAKRLGADVSLLLYRRTEQEMPAYEHEVELARREGVEIRFLTSPVAFVGDGHVEGVRCAEMRLGAPDESGRRRPEPVPGSEFVIPVDTVVKAIGQQPRDEFRRLLESVDRGRPQREPEDLRRRRRRQRRRERRAGRRRSEARGLGARGDAAMNGMTEIRWHARAGQGAKTASQILALALLRSGKGVQAFPEYGPERRGAPLRAFTRVADRPIRRHDAITDPDVVVVLEPSLVHETGVADGLQPDGVVLLNGEEVPPELEGVDVRCVPADRLASTLGSTFVNIVMLGAVAAELGEPPLDELQEAAVETLGRKVAAEDVRRALSEGYAWTS